MRFQCRSDHAASVRLWRASHFIDVPESFIASPYKRNGEDSPLRTRAERYLSLGYSKLLNYRDASGGFTYWGRGNPDVALTA